MNRRRQKPRRGLTLIELMFAMTITAIVGAAMTASLSAVIVGVDSQRDTRSHVIRAHAAQSRVGAYIVPSRAILHAGESELVLWFNDARQSGTVHGSEIRWLLFDEESGTIEAHFVRLPINVTPTLALLADREHAADSDWMEVLRWYDNRGMIRSVTLVDGLSAFAVSTDEDHPMDSRYVMIHVTFEGRGGELDSLLGGTLMRYAPPDS